MSSSSPFLPSSSVSPPLPTRKGKSSSSSSESSSRRMKNVMLLVLILGGALPVLIPCWDFFVTYQSLSSIKYIYTNPNPHNVSFYSSPSDLSMLKNIFYSSNPSVLFCVNTSHFAHYGGQGQGEGNGKGFSPPKVLERFALENSHHSYGFSLYVSDCFQRWNSERGDSLWDKFKLKMPKYLESQWNKLSSKGSGSLTFPPQLDLSLFPVIYTANLRRPQVLEFPIHNVTQAAKIINQRMIPTVKVIKDNSQFHHQCFQSTHSLSSSTPSYCVVMMVSPSYNQKVWEEQNGIGNDKKKMSIPSTSNLSPTPTSPFPSNYILPSDRSPLDNLILNFRQMKFYFLDVDQWELSIQKHFPTLETFVKKEWPRVLVIKRERNSQYHKRQSNVETEDKEGEQEQEEEEEEVEDDGPAARENAHKGNTKTTSSSSSVSSSSSFSPVSLSVKVYRESIDIHLLSMFLQNIQNNQTKMAELSSPLNIQKRNKNKNPSFNTKTNIKGKSNPQEQTNTNTKTKTKSKNESPPSPSPSSSPQQNRPSKSNKNENKNQISEEESDSLFMDDNDYDRIDESKSESEDDENDFIDLDHEMEGNEEL